VKADTVGPGQLEFYFADVDTHVLVENAEGGPVIRATRNSFSESRKSHFVRQLAAEGYIPDRYEWFCHANSDEPQSVKWLVDRSWVRLDPEIRRRAARNFLYTLLCGGLFWLFVLLLLLGRRV